MFAGSCSGAYARNVSDPASSATCARSEATAPGGLALGLGGAPGDAVGDAAGGHVVAVPQAETTSATTMRSPFLIPIRR